MANSGTRLRRSPRSRAPAHCPTTKRVSWLRGSPTFGEDLSGSPLHRKFNSLTLTLGPCNDARVLGRFRLRGPSPLRPCPCKSSWKLPKEAPAAHASRHACNHAWGVEAVQRKQLPAKEESPIISRPRIIPLGQLPACHVCYIRYDIWPRKTYGAS